jgi:hypothetical protein
MNLFDLYSEEDQAAWQKLAMQPYVLTARAYFNRSYKLYPRTAEDNSLLFYCALELRCAIEKVFYEYLSCLRRNSLSEAESKLWSAKDLKSSVFAVEPDFIEKIDFLNIIYESRDIKYPITLPDVDRLSRDYGRLNGYLHALKAETSDVRNIRWWAELRTFIEELHGYAWPYCSQARIRLEFNNVAERLFEDYKAGRKTRQDLLDIFRSGSENYEVSSDYRFYHK